ncbi:MAG TPA: DUF4159 domain-containing protein, partial [Balneolaceae bacterium]|nr:DUF4159 domain-containing protein [Balneolaceae bacterium]
MKFSRSLPLIFLGFVLGLALPTTAQQTDQFKVARIKYRGGGDWYNDPAALKNMAKYLRQHTSIAINPDYDDVSIG